MENREIKTVIGDLKQMIQSTCEAVCSFKNNPLISECEDFTYELLIIKAKEDLRAELERAKKIKPK